MKNHIMEAWKADIDIRTSGLEQRKADHRRSARGEARRRVQGCERHGHRVSKRPREFKETYGVPLFKTADRSIVISGDTNRAPRSSSIARSAMS